MRRGNIGRARTAGGRIRDFRLCCLRRKGSGADILYYATTIWADVEAPEACITVLEKRGLHGMSGGESIENDREQTWDDAGRDQRADRGETV